jgi:hypothetical protein
MASPKLAVADLLARWTKRAATGILAAVTRSAYLAGLKCWRTVCCQASSLRPTERATTHWILWHLDRENEAASWDAFVSGFQKGYDKEGLPQFDRIPSPKLHVMPLNVKFGLAGRSLAVFTESLGASVITVT